MLDISNKDNRLTAMKNKCRGWHMNSWYSCKNYNKIYTHTMLCKLHGSLESISWKCRYLTLSLTNQCTYFDRGSSVKQQITGTLELRRESELLLCLPKQRALLPHKGDSDFFEFIGSQQETLYFVCSKCLKRKGAWRRRIVCVLQLCGLLKKWKHNPSKSKRKLTC